MSELPFVNSKLDPVNIICDAPDCITSKVLNLNATPLIVIVELPVILNPILHFATPPPPSTTRFAPAPVILTPVFAAGLDISKTPKKSHPTVSTRHVSILNPIPFATKKQALKAYICDTPPEHMTPVAKLANRTLSNVDKSPKVSVSPVASGINDSIAMLDIRIVPLATIKSLVGVDDITYAASVE